MTDVDPFGTESAARLRALQARGTSEDTNVVVELDGTGRMTSVSIASIALEQSHSTLEAAVLAAARAAYDNLTAARAEVGGELLTAARERIGDLTAEIRAISDRADSRLAATLQTVQQLSERITGPA